MKKTLALFLAVVMLFACTVGFAGCGEKENVVYIGVYEPTSGDNGAGGKQEVLGMQYANSLTPTVKIGDTDYKVELVYADNESSTDKAISAATTLISKKVSVVLGSYGSSVAIAASETFANANVPAIGVTCTNPQVTEGNDHYFRICFLDPFQGTVLANFAKDSLKAKKVYCLGQLGNDYDQGLIKYFKEAAEKLGMTVITANFPENNSDFTSYLTSAKNEKADVIFAPCSTSYAQLIVEQAAAQNVKTPILAGDTWDSNVILNAAKGKDVPIYVSTFYQEGGDPTFDSGLKTWLKAAGNEQYLTNNGGNDIVSAVTAMGYDAYYVALEALKAAGSTKSADVKAALPKVTYKGVSGDIVFGENGDAVRDIAYIKNADNKNGAWTFVTKQGVAK